MIGDHYRRAAGTATLLLTALDGIFGTHNRKGSAGEAGTKLPAPRKRSLAARSERSERPVAGTDAAAQADQAGIGTSRSPGATASQLGTCRAHGEVTNPSPDFGHQNPAGPYPSPA